MGEGILDERATFLERPQFGALYMAILFIVLLIFGHGTMKRNSPVDRTSIITTVKDPLKGAHDRLHHIIAALSQLSRIRILSTNAWWLSQTGESIYQSGLESIRQFQTRLDVKYFTNRNASPILQELIGSIIAMTSRLEPNLCMHLNYHSTFPGWALSRRFRRRDIPNLMDIADDLPNFYKKSSTLHWSIQPIAYEISRLMLLDAIKVSDHVTCTSELLADCYSVPKKKRTIIPNGVDASQFYPMEVGAERKRLGLNDRFVIGFIGTLREWVDLEMLVEALIEVDKQHKATVLIVGGGSHDPSIGKMVENAGIDFRMIGEVPYSKVPDWINLLDVGVVPFKINEMTDNSLPMKIFEYMACGKPVISTPLKSVRQPLGTSLLYSRNPLELSSNIVDLIENRDQYMGLSRGGLELVRTVYNWKNIEDQFKSIFENLSNRSDEIIA